MNPSPPPRNKSTNVRPVTLQAFAVMIRAVGAVQPNLAARMMLKAFCTPRRLAAPAWAKGLEPEREFLTLQGEQIAVYRWSPSLNGKKVLLAHGWNGCSQQLRSVVEPLRSRGYAVYAFDQAAHGSSSGTTSNLIHFARTLSAVRQHLGPVHAIIAHSLGAPAAAFAISQGLPVERLVMIAPPAHPIKIIGDFWRSLKIADALAQRMNGVIERTEGALLSQLDLSQLARHLAMPTLIIHDRMDREVPFNDGEEWSLNLSDAQLLATEGLGHNRLLAASVVTEAISRFMDGERVTPRGTKRVGSELGAPVSARVL